MKLSVTEKARELHLMYQVLGFRAELTGPLSAIKAELDREIPREKLLRGALVALWGRLTPTERVKARNFLESCGEEYANAAELAAEQELEELANASESTPLPTYDPRAGWGF